MTVDHRANLDMEQLYRQYQPLVLGYLIRQLGSVPLAEDLCQSSFMKAFKSLHTYRGDASFKNWLFMIVKTTVADHWKQHYAHSTVTMEEWYAATDQPIEEVELNNTVVEQKLQHILEQLPPDYRAILEYRFLRNYSIKETATALQITESNAKVRQYRALQLAKQITIL